MGQSAEIQVRGGSASTEGLLTPLLFAESELLGDRPRERLLATLSAGEGSWRAAKVAQLLDVQADRRLIFTDTLYEDADAYRFLIESAADLTGRHLDWVPMAGDFPDYRAPADTPIEDYAGNPAWRHFLADIRAQALRDIPELTWIVEGRDPWEIYRDERFVGNSLRDPCSKVLKRRALSDWLDRHGNPQRDILLYGIGIHEAHRLDDGQGGGLRPRWAARGWRAEAPLVECEHRLRSESLTGELLVSLYAPVDHFGLVRPRLYGLGYGHNNCGGNCCKAGMAHWQHRFRVQPDRYAYDAMMERKCRKFLGTESGTFMTDRSGGGKRPLSLDEFAQRLRAAPNVVHENEPGTSGCGCMTDGPDEVPA